jgi:hypothetical protein
MTVAIFIRGFQKIFATCSTRTNLKGNMTPGLAQKLNPPYKKRGLPGANRVGGAPSELLTRFSRMI